MNGWIALVAASVVTFGAKSLPMVGRATLPSAWLRRASDMVGPALLGALAASGLSSMATTVDPAAVACSGLVGVAVAVRRRSIPLTVGAGLGTYAVVRLLVR